jgi:hypothetical protein
MDVYGNVNSEGLECIKRIAQIGGRRNGSNWKVYLRQTKLRPYFVAHPLKRRLYGKQNVLCEIPQQTSSSY